MKPTEGHLEILDRGFGFLRGIEKNFQPTSDDTFVPAALISQFNLSEGLLIKGRGLPGEGKNTNLKLQEIETVNGVPIEAYGEIIGLHELISINPTERFRLTTGPKDHLGQALDLIVPIGKGQRGLIISPPKAGKTTILRHMANAILANHADTDVFVLLVDERPEEVTDFKRGLTGGYVLHSSADQTVSLYFNFVGKSRESVSKAPAATTDSSGPSTKGQDDSAAPASDSASVLAAGDVTDTASDTGDAVDSSSVEPSPDSGKSRTRAARNQGGRKAARKKTTTAQTSSPANNAAKSSAAKSNESATGQSTGTSSTKSDDGPTGRLRISMPAGVTGEIRIFVDGQKKGKAPRILSLSAGLHEVRFEMDGKSKLKMVSIKTGVTSDVTPRF